MLIKRITAKGDPVPYTAEEAVSFAVARAAKAKNTLDVVYWIDRKSIKAATFRSSPTDKAGGWEAWAEGQVNVGKTVAVTGKFHATKVYDFKIHYRSGKDEWGIPDIEVISDSVLAEVETNPAKMVGEVPAKQAPVNIIGEVVAQPVTTGEVVARGTIRAKVSKGKN